MDVRLDSLASPARARSLLTVRAAISSARSSLSPRSSNPSLMCWYCRSRLSLHPACGMSVTSVGRAEASLPRTADRYPMLARRNEPYVSGG